MLTLHYLRLKKSLSYSINLAVSRGNVKYWPVRPIFEVLSETLVFCKNNRNQLNSYSSCLDILVINACFGVKFLRIMLFEKLYET